MPDIAPNERPPEEARLERILGRYERARARRAGWEPLWQDSYDYALPQRASFTRSLAPGEPRMARLYDGTALDAVDQLAASLLANLTPPWSQWFGLKPGPDLSPEESEALSPVLEKAARTIQDHFDRSNFAVEIHQCFLDLIVGGTASLFFEENEPGGFSAFRFSAVPLSDTVLEEGESGLLDGTFRLSDFTLAQLTARYPLAELPARVLKDGGRDAQLRFRVLESVLPEEGAFRYSALLLDVGAQAVALESARLGVSPVINFRWVKTPGEIYGRSPVMKALPDIKTANKVVELVLKNASISVTGIWQADDDGVLNPANIELVPGSIIPKAVGSKGLTPLEMPGRFDISQIVLEDLRGRIRHALLTDTLGPVGTATMTATEVIERSAEMALLLGATYGRLQAELLTPLVQRAFTILRRRGEVPDVNLDGRTVALDYRSPLARAQGQRNVQNTLNWISSVLAMGPQAAEAVNLPEAARFLGQAMGVPSDLIRNELPPLAQQEAANVSG
ncbi:MAG: phage tail protein [Alphaproteobacteria bacterium]|nr:phage tail protein [Alphaproteobacteria bacterium]